MDDKDRKILTTLCQVVALQLQGLQTWCKAAVVRENALKLALGRRGLLTDAEWTEMTKEVEAGAAIELALGFSDEDQREMERIFAIFNPILADRDGVVLKPVVESYKRMYRPA